jgi:hypothetical protein
MFRVADYSISTLCNPNQFSSIPGRARFLADASGPQFAVTWANIDGQAAGNGGGHEGKASCLERSIETPSRRSLAQFLF